VVAAGALAALSLLFAESVLLSAFASPPEPDADSLLESLLPELLLLA
jgi:hypothetical protein